MIFMIGAYRGSYGGVTEYLHTTAMTAEKSS